jgi:hypothetical protein
MWDCLKYICRRVPDINNNRTRTSSVELLTHMLTESNRLNIKNMENLAE